MVLPPQGSLVAGKYRLESLLGEGGMGAVFRARHEVMDKPVAVKWLKPTCGDQVAARHRFMQEARAAARIRHPNVVDVYDVGEQDGCLFMVMELLEGETFADFLERSGIPVAEAIRHLLAAMRGVAAAHAAGITHRDIKPENVFIAFDALHVEGVAKILDFGISKLNDEPQPQLTLVGTTMGTPHYMSYEQIRCMTDVDHRTDIYAFGVLLYQALTGTLPYDADTLPGIVMQAASGRAVRPIELRPDLPPELDALVMRAIALRPDDRFQSMDAMINALTRIQLASVAWSAAAERTSLTPRSAASALLLLGTPHQPSSTSSEAPRASFFSRARQRVTSSLARPRARFDRERRAQRPAARAKTRPAPLNPWLGMVGGALGIMMGGALYTRLMTPASPASAKASASAPVSSLARGERPGSGAVGVDAPPVVRGPAQQPPPYPRVAVRGATLGFESQRAATQVCSAAPPGESAGSTPKPHLAGVSAPGQCAAPVPSGAPAGSALARSSAPPPRPAPMATQSPLTTGPRSQDTALVAPSTATNPPPPAKLAQRPAAGLHAPAQAPAASSTGPSAATTPAAEPAPSPIVPAAHRSGPLRLEDL